MKKNKKQRFVRGFALTSILILAFFLRAYNIQQAPAGVYPDEAVNGMDALKANESGKYLWFYEDNNGREGLYINLIAFSYKLFGVTIFGLKFPSIIFGVLIVLGVFLLTYELFKKSWRAGLMASYLTAVSFWAINFSRIGFRAIMLPAVLVFSSYFLFRGIKDKKFYNFAISGLIFGIGLHTYIAFRIAPLILIVIFIALVITKQHLFRDYWKQALVFIATMVVSAAPILLTFFAYPEYLESRSASISILSPEVNQGNLIETFGRSFGLSLAKYNFWGDQNWRHNYPPYPVLNPLVGITFLIGLLYLIYKFFHLFFLRWKRNVHDRKLYVYAFLLAWFFAMLVPEFMTAEGLPHALRSIGTLPVVYIIATVPFLWILGKAEDYSPSTRVIAASLVIVSFLFVGIFNTMKYHYFWANNPSQHKAFEANLLRVSDYLSSIPEEKNKIVVTESMQRIPIKLFNYDNLNLHYVYPGEIDEFMPNDSLKKDSFVIIFTEKNEDIIKKIHNYYPDLMLKEISDTVDNKFWAME